MRVGDATISPKKAASWLASYNPATVQWYDCAGGAGPARASQDSLDLADLGRMVCVGASLTYKRGQRLLASAADAPWPSTPVRALVDVQTEDDDWYRDPSVDAMWQHFKYWASIDGLKFGTVSKLMHIKWSEFIPIADSEFRRVYRDRAVKLHNGSPLIRSQLGDKGKRKANANVRAYWRAFSEDLAAASADLDDVRDLVKQSKTNQAHRDRLVSLSDLRLMDMLAWGAGRGTI